MRVRVLMRACVWCGVPVFYSKQLEGWQRLYPQTFVPIGEDGRIEVMLEQPAPSHGPMRGPGSLHGAAEFQQHMEQLAQFAAAVALPDARGGDDVSATQRVCFDPSGGSDAVQDEAAVGDGERDGFFAIGVYNAKTVENVGTLWRSAFMLGASYLFTIGTRCAWEKACDTYKSWRHVPAFRFDGWDAFCASAPVGATWVAVEMGGVPLHEFKHPERAVYVLGAEDAGLPASIVRACHHCVSLEGVRASSYNVSVAGTLIMYDRLRKLGHQAQGAPEPLA